MTDISHRMDSTQRQSFLDAWHAIVGAPMKKPRPEPVVLELNTEVAVQFNQTVSVNVWITETGVLPQRLLIREDGTPGGAADWIVNDLRIAGRSQFVQSGDLPGSMFGTSSIDNFVSLEPARQGNRIELRVTYIGPNADGAVFNGQLIGSVYGSAVDAVRGNVLPIHPPHVVVVADPKIDPDAVTIPVQTADLKLMLDAVPRLPLTRAPSSPDPLVLMVDPQAWDIFSMDHRWACFVVDRGSHRLQLTGQAYCRLTTLWHRWRQNAMAADWGRPLPESLADWEVAAAKAVHRTVVGYQASEELRRQVQALTSREVSVVMGDPELEQMNFADAL